jgi:nucleotide-binding universal stress UspA family protein
VATDGDGAARLAHHIVDGPYRLERVTFLVVLPFASEANVGARSQAERIARAAAVILHAARLQVNELIRYGSAGEVVVRLANEARARAVFVGRRGSGLTSAARSVSDYGVRHSTSTVTVVSWHD